MTISKPSQFIFELALLAVTSCSPTDDTSTDAGDEGDVFLAVASDFKCYDSWTKFDLGDGDGGVDDSGCAHVANVPRIAYMNQLPPHGSTSFPVGTIIVKEIHTTPNPPDWPVFGMVKRGGGFGSGDGYGCEGWEWYGLNLTTDACDAHMQWSGLQPSPGEIYASCGACASCHSAAQSNDCVLAPQMSLGQW
ncbi:MAG TPA: hypothetical protein VH054_13480 [Polyangiaceae bacterium]|jgi:hypothetical protein|nr:hypothetical protein [Polyangiaceae bacterium]